MIYLDKGNKFAIDDLISMFRIFNITSFKLKVNIYFYKL